MYVQIESTFWFVINHVAFPKWWYTTPESAAAYNRIHEDIWFGDGHYG
jgi:hypothetical protein